MESPVSTLANPKATVAIQAWIQEIVRVLAIGKVTGDDNGGEGSSIGDCDGSEEGMGGGPSRNS
jgi:hypothetical protein